MRQRSRSKIKLVLNRDTLRVAGGVTVPHSQYNNANCGPIQSNGQPTCLGCPSGDTGCCTSNGPGACQ
jgi:hypothetical protein